MKPIAEFEIVDHGVAHAQYFQGAGVSFTRWKDCYTGVAASARDAASGALDQLAYDYDISEAIEDAVAELSDLPTAELRSAWDECGDDDNCELYHYITIFVR